MLTNAWALTNDNQQPIHINSAQQAVDMATNTATLIGNVIIKRGSIDIRADKVVITIPDGKKGNEVVEGYGSPVSFYQLQDNGKPIRGHSQKIRYETANNLVVLTGNAYLEQLEINVKSDRITYMVNKQHIEAISNKGKQVTTVLMPLQLQNKTALQHK
ncbi:Lipopolysaccharide export system protein LptA precursor [Sodalis endosymbiont of Henestaris halophilus]|nr:Lipopolysaccharide export system protein LptA precursor [Sodalis endosymbiont of Henestaris halophilus]